VPSPGQASGCYLMITVRKVTRSLAAVMPRWLVVICGVCLVIPLARLAALLFTPGCAWFSPRESAARRACGRAASRSACGEMPGLRIGPAGDGGHARKGLSAAAALPPGGHRHKVRCPAALPGAGSAGHRDPARRGTCAPAAGGGQRSPPGHSGDRAGGGGAHGVRSPQLRDRDRGGDRGRRSSGPWAS
jgi:hypothetical protein